MEPDRLADTVDYPDMTPRAGMQAPRIPSRLVQVDLAASSHQGRVRPNNEDHYLVVRAGRFLQTLMTTLPGGHIPDEFVDMLYGMVVADGMGGAAAGEVASSLAITVLVNLVLDTPDWIMTADESRVDEVVDRMVQRFRNVNAALVEQAQQDPSLAGMGTTLTLAWSLGADLFVAHIGDSRVFLLRQGKLHAVTHPHTVAQEMANLGMIPARDVATHRLRHLLTRVIGREDLGNAPEVERVGLADGDRLLLCTDGLTDMVDEATIEAELRRDTTAAEACQALVDLALDRGGKDNVTVIVADYRIPQGP
jgi:protein phosphatase